MIKDEKTQKGFGLIEGLLIVLILAIVSIGGYYVVHRNNNSSNNSTTNQQKTLTISEWGVRMDTNPDPSNIVLSNLTYKYYPKDPTRDEYISFVSDDINRFTSLCKSGSWGIYRYSPNDPSPLVGVGDSENTKVKDSATIKSSPNFKNVGNYYYERWYPKGGSCDDEESSILGRMIERTSVTMFETLTLSP